MVDCRPNLRPVSRWRQGWLAAGLLLAVWSGRLPGAELPAPTAEQLERFEKVIRPLLAENCWQCHGAEKQKGGLRLDRGDTLLAGGDTGPAVVPGQADESLLISAVRYDPDGYQMPPRGKLGGEAIAILEQWVNEGAYWPVEVPVAQLVAGQPDIVSARRGHWSLRPIADPEPPAVEDSAWIGTPVDRFILAELEARGLKPAPPAGSLVWLRRVTFDLTGLPPTWDEAREFESHDGPQARAAVVERLLASPHYGERWARHWLDLMRYAETAGHEFDFNLPEAYRYRDYCVRALNADLSYFDFVREHLAGDLIDPPRRDPATGDNESILATASFFLGESKHSPVDLAVDRADRVDNQIDVLSKAFLGLTIACARCHDHKFDPITQRDYYALAGVLRSSHYQQAVISPPEPRKQLREQLAELQQQASRVVGGPGGWILPAPQAADLLPVATFDAASFEGWSAWGEAFGAGPVPATVARLSTAGEAAGCDWSQAGTADSGAVAEPLDGALRSPTFTLERNFLWYRLRGQGTRLRLVLENFQQIREPIYGGLEFSPGGADRWTWHGQNVAMWRGMRGYLEVLDPGPGWVALDGVWMSDSAPPSDGAGEPETRPGLSADTLAQLDPLDQRFRALLAQWQPPRWTMAMFDGTPEDERLHIRGSTQRLGEAVPRRVPEVLGASGPSPGSPSSGRLEWAEMLIDPANPLVSRVMANRIWHHHFGRGIVGTPDDFGAMGEPPTHPALLDYLARRLLRSGGSLKALHRELVLSSTYAMSSQGSGVSRERDADGRLCSRAPLRRLEAEAVRDALLSVSGRLDSTVGGPSVPPYLTEFMQGRGRPEHSGPLDGDGRRTLYLNVRRNFLTPLLLAFDFPQPFSTMGRRSTSNVPAQALVMTNNPLVLDQARIWSERLSRLALSDAERVDRMYLEAFTRHPSAAERETALEFISSQSTPPAGPAGADPAAQSGSAAQPAPDRWTELARVLLSMKEFVYVP